MRLDARGYGGYRRSDAAAMRILCRGPVPVGQLGTALGVTRQAARKVADGLRQRGFATTERDLRDSRQLNVTLTAAGHEYARAVIAVIGELNDEIGRRADQDLLAAADAVLRAAMFDDSTWRRAARLPRPGQPVPPGAARGQE